jgi:hypothetical protein
MLSVFDVLLLHVEKELLLLLLRERLLVERRCGTHGCGPKTYELQACIRKGARSKMQDTAPRLNLNLLLLA